MSVFQSVTIDNYRGIKHLELQDLKPINLLVGKNNCGKTSVLEAVFMLLGLQSIDYLNRLATFRETEVVHIGGYDNFFHNLNPAIPIHLFASYQDGARFRELSLTAKLGNSASNSASEDLFVSTGKDVINKLILSYRESSNFFGQKELKAGLKEATISEEGEVSNQFDRWVYIKVGSNPIINTLVGAVIDRKKESQLVNVLQTVDSKIKDIMIGSNDLVMVDVGLEKRMPLKNMGEGTIRVTTVASAVAVIDKGILLVDEIDTGLHYTALTTMWEAVIEGCLTNGTQLFATTHSDECVKALNVVLKTKYPDQDIARLIRIEAGEEAHKAVYYDADMINALFRIDVEYR